MMTHTAFRGGSMPGEGQKNIKFYSFKKFHVILATLVYCIPCCGEPPHLPDLKM